MSALWVILSYYYHSCCGDNDLDDDGDDDVDDDDGDDDGDYDDGNNNGDDDEDLLFINTYLRVSVAGFERIWGPISYLLLLQLLKFFCYGAHNIGP